MRRVVRFVLLVLTGVLLLDKPISSSSSPIVVRGPYLQQADSDEVTIRWRTDQPSDSRVTYSTNSTTQEFSVSNSALTAEHTIRLQGLSPNTRYFYTVGTQQEKLAGTASYYFYTPPHKGDSVPTRIWVIGDSGTANANARRVRNAFARFAKQTYTDVWLMLGDNAYESGTDAEYQAALFRMFRKLLLKTVVWPTLGNHDVVLDPNVPRKLPYYDIFDLPERAEAGGVRSGTEDYYSFDHGLIHFISLDSTTKERSPQGPMLTWLKRDLRKNRLPWVIAYWHHSPYSQGGTHDSDEDTAMRQMRENAVPILERYGVDLVLTGHSHSYQRSFLLNGHYEASSTFRHDMVLDEGTGREDVDGPYVKSSDVRARGTVYVVVGSSGKLEGAVQKHPAMFVAFRQFGSFVIDIHGNRLDGRFIRDTGKIGDYFTIVQTQ